MIEHDIWFSTLKLKYSMKSKLLTMFKTSENILNYSRDGSFCITYDENEVYLKNLIKYSYDENIINRLKAIVYKNDVKIITFNDINYPKELKYYEDSPSVLYYKGDISKVNLNKNAALVGSRNCSAYGKSVASSIAKELTLRGVNIISGLARGIDAAAQESCMKSNGYTCGILGCGIDIIYPKDNFRLFNQMYNSGCVISEFVPGTKPLHYNFPVRNRLISGISDIIIVVEAGEKSGSLITAGLALDQGKDVMAVPGSLFSEQSKGTNKLLYDGAHVFTEMKDIYDLMRINDEILKVNKNYNSSSILNKILNTLTDKPLHVDEIINITRIDINQIYELLFELQLDNQILALSGNYYVRVASN